MPNEIFSGDHSALQIRQCQLHMVSQLAHSALLYAFNANIAKNFFRLSFIPQTQLFTTKHAFSHSASIHKIWLSFYIEAKIYIILINLNCFIIGLFLFRLCFLFCFLSLQVKMYFKFFLSHYFSGLKWNRGFRSSDRFFLLKPNWQF